MDHVLRRFPLASEMILKNLDDKSLARSKEASRKIYDVLRNSKFFWIRILNNYSERFEGHEEAWKEVIDKSKIMNIRQLAVGAQKFFQKNYLWKKIAPLHIAAENNDHLLCIFIVGETTNKNPADFVGDTTLHFAAKI